MTQMPSRLKSLGGLLGDALGGGHGHAADAPVDRWCASSKECR
jgi:hypothetical protein